MSDHNEVQQSSSDFYLTPCPRRQTSSKKPLPREMQQHTYAILRRVEEKHWWFVGRRRIIRSFLERLYRDHKDSGAVQAGPVSARKILDVGCGTGANLEMLAEFGKPLGLMSPTTLCLFAGNGD
jgi:SAM-dependent methyltransferase